MRLFIRLWVTRPFFSFLSLLFFISPFFSYLAPFAADSDYLCFGFSGWSGRGVSRNASSELGLRLPVSRTGEHENLFRCFLCVEMIARFPSERSD